MTFAATGTAPSIVITQTGTDTSLAGLVGIAGVSVKGTTSQKKYMLSGARIVVTGALTFDPYRESIYFDETCGTTPHVNITGASAVMTIGASTANPPSTAPAITVAFASSYGAGQIQTGQGGKLLHYSGTIRVSGGIAIGGTDGGSYLGAYLDFAESSNAGVNGRLLAQSPLMTYGPRALLTGDGLAVSSAAIPISNLTVSNPKLFGISTSVAVGTSNAPYQISNVTLLGAPSGGLVYPWANSCLSIYGLAGGGNVSKVGGGIPANTNCLIRTYGRANLTVTSGGAPVAGAEIFSRDTNNGARAAVVCGTNSGTVDGVPDTTVSGQTDAAGTTGALDYLLQVWWRSSANVMSTDWRTLAPGANTRRVYIASYAHRLTSTVIDMSAGGTLAQPVFLDVDPSVTLAKSTAQALAQVATLDDVYDLAKLWRSTAGNLEYPTASTQPVTTDGAVLDIGGLSLVLDPAASTTFSLVGGTITVKGSSLAAGVKHVSIKSTATVTATGGAEISATISDAAGDSALVFSGIDTWSAYSDASRATLLGSGAGSDKLRFSYSSGTTYYLTVIASSIEFRLASTPSGAGETVVSLSQVALLTALQAQVSAIAPAIAEVKVDTGLIKAVSL